MKKRLLNILLPSVVISTMLCSNVCAGSGSGFRRRPNYGVNTVSIGDIEEYGNEYKTKYEEGQYLVGTDMSAGEYIVFADLTETGYFCISSDPNEDDIIYNNNFDYNSIITVNDGEYLNLTRCFAVPFNDVKELDLSSTGMFKVGTHVQSGEYKLISNENEEGYYCLYSSSRQDDIISNDNFSGNRYVSIEDGQYLELVRCKFETTPENISVIKNETNNNQVNTSTNTSSTDITDSEQIKKVQEMLNKLGYNCGTPDGIPGQNTSNAVIKFKQDNGLGETSNINQDLVDKLNELTIPEGLSTNETDFENWESTNRCMLFPFMGVSDLAGFSFTTPSGQADSEHKEVDFIFKDNGEYSSLDNAEMYYGVVDQKITYTGLYTNDKSYYNDQKFKEACIRLMLGYNIHSDDNGHPVLNLTRERAEELVNYILDNSIEHCVVDNMRIRTLFKDDENYYSFHMEY